MKRFIKSLLSRTPYRIVRDRGANRFEAVETCLRQMRNRGFVPSVVIDGGAHWVVQRRCSTIFPDALVHLIEPQLACREPLQKLGKKHGKFIIHECALGDMTGHIPFTDTNIPNTGAHVSAEQGTVEVEVSTLDEMFRAILPSGRALLKLDLQGYELHALRGGTKTFCHPSK